MNWNHYLKRIRSRDVGDKMDVPKGAVTGDLPSRFYESVLSLPDGANKVYREDRAEYSIQVREYEDRYQLQLDRFNPTYDPVGHAVVDAPGYTLGAIAAGAMIKSAFKS